MKRISDKKTIDRYVRESGIEQLFSGPIDGLLELFFFRKDEFVLYENEPSDYLYFLLDGEVKIYSSIGNGKYLDHGHYPRFRVIGEAAILWGNPASASVQCASNSHFFGVSLARHRAQLLDENRFLRYICEILCAQMTMQRQSSHALFFPLENRMADLVLRNAPDGLLQYSLVACADLLSASYRHLLRVVKKMCEEGLLERAGGARYRVADRAGLERLATQLAHAKGPFSVDE